MTTLSDSYTTLGLISSTKRRGFIPAGTGLSNAQFLQILTEEMRSYVVAFLKGIREEYLITSVDLAISSDHVVVPERAVGAALRTIQWVRSNLMAFPLVRVEPENQYSYAMTSSEPKGYVLQGNTLTLVPGVTSGTLRLAYQLRPGQLVLPDACGLISVINTLTGEVTVAAKPSTFVSTATFDLVSSRPNFCASALDLSATIASNVLTFPLPLPTTLRVGDYVCLAGETCIPPLPTEVHDLLAQAAAYKIAQAAGSARSDLIKTGLAELKSQMSAILSPRSDGSSRPIISRSRLGGRRY